MVYVSLKEEKKELKLEVKKTGILSIFSITDSKLKKGMYLNASDDIIKSFGYATSEFIQRMIQYKDRYTYKIQLYYYDGNPSDGINPEDIIDTEFVSLSFNGKDKQIVIPYNIAIIKKMFPFSEAIHILEENVKLGNSYNEEIGFYSIHTDEMNGWIVYPHKTINPDLNTDEGRLANILIRYGNGEHLDTKSRETNENSKRNHAIVVEKSTGWKNAKDYTGDITTWENCIYTLASEPDDDGICNVYIGEATNPKSTKKHRIDQQCIDGEIYIDHTKEEAKKHRFTRFRIDKLKDESGEYLHDMQDAMIGISSMLVKGCPNGYKMTNKAQGKSFGAALKEN